MKSEMCLIVVVSPLVSVMRDQVGQLKHLGFSVASIGLSKEYEEETKRREKGSVNLFSEIKKLWQVCNSHCMQMYILVFAFRGCYCLGSFTLQDFF